MVSSLFLKLHDSSRASQVSYTCAHAHGDVRRCGSKTNGKLQALTLCFLLCNLLSVPLNTKYFWSSFKISSSSTLVFFCVLPTNCRANCKCREVYRNSIFFQNARLRDVINFRNPKPTVPTPHCANRAHGGGRGAGPAHSIAPVTPGTACGSYSFLSYYSPLPSPHPIL